MTVEHAHTVDNGVYQQPRSDDASSPGGPAAAIVEYLDEEHGGYKTPDVVAPAASAASFGGQLARVLVLHDFRNAEVWRASIFEGAASFAMTFVGILTTISTLESTFSHPVLAIAVFQGLILSLCILAAAPASGGHVNPCITWTEALTGHITPVRGFLYILFQILGSIVASVAAKAVVGSRLALQYSLGGCYLRSHGEGLDPARAVLLETLLALFVLFISYSVALDPPRLPRTGYTLAPFIVGGIVGLCIFAGGNLVAGYGGAGINPGRCIGPAVAMGGAMWDGHWVFWIGPGVAGIVMAGFYWNIPPTHVQVYKLRKAKRAVDGIQGARVRKGRRSASASDSKTSIRFPV